MEIDLIREKLRAIIYTIAEIQSMLPEETPRPHLVVVKNGDFELEDDPDLMKPSRAREGFPVLCGGKRRAAADSAREGEKISGKQDQNGRKKEFLKLHREELKRLPKLFEKIKRALDGNIRSHNGFYEKRARINGVSISASAPTPEACEMKFLQKLTDAFPAICTAEPDADAQIREIREPKIPVAAEDPSTDVLSRDAGFAAWADLWFREIFRPSVTPYTYKHDRRIFERHILPEFRDKKICEISPLDCIRPFNRLKESGIERTAETCFGLLNRIFDFAVESEILARNPMAKMKKIKHTRRNGTPLSLPEEKQLLLGIAGTPYEAAILLGLYAGLRPCEIPTARIEGRFIVAENCKQKDRSKKVYKKIPITPMLAPHLDLLTASLPLRSFNDHAYASALKRILPEHRAYDLRDTFATRTQECGVPEHVVQIFMGHSPRTLLGKVYTKFSDDYLYEEGQKVRY